VRDVATQRPLDLDTPIYIASQTKSYIGLLAHQLDRQGVLSLDSTLADHWPRLKLPGDIDPGAWTLSDLLNHRVPIESDLITKLEAYIQSPDPSRYPDLLAKHSQARAEGFDYDNLGYNIYAAILHARTGKPWQDWLQESLLTPLSLTRTSARTSDFAQTDLAYSHQWRGETAGWERVAPKPDAIMQSAGGMLTSPADLGRWLQWHLGGEAPEGFDAALLKAAHRVGAKVDPKARNAYELPCDGYAFGWNVCDFNGHRLYIHGGGYTGARTMMAFAPGLGVGIGVFSNSDNMTGWLTSRTVVQYLQYLTGHPEATEWAALRQKLYPERVAELLQQRQQAVASARAEPRWQGWQWQPTADALAEFIGVYRSEDLQVDATISAIDEQLEFHAGALRRKLEPAAADLFAATLLSLDAPEPLRILRDTEGTIQSLEYDGIRYLRQAPAVALH
jgi:CubicO group peptidase (beta-lactamase class C family)